MAWETPPFFLEISIFSRIFVKVKKTVSLHGTGFSQKNNIHER